MLCIMASFDNDSTGWMFAAFIALSLLMSAFGIAMMIWSFKMRGVDDEATQS